MPELYPHQLEAIEKLDNGKILYGGVGTGKSLTVLGYYVKNESPKDIYVITTAKKRDSLEWLREAARYAIGESRDSTAHGTITIDSWNNIDQYSGVENAFFIFDEQRVVGYGHWAKTFIKITKRNRWVLLSATPGDTWLDYIPVFIANGFYPNAATFKREHVVYAPFSRFPKVTRYLDVETLEKYRNIVLVEMPYAKHTVRHVEEILVAYDPLILKQLVETRWNPFTNEPMIDVAELFRVMRRIVNSDTSRQTELLRLISVHPKLIVWYNFDYELLILRDLLSTNGILFTEWNGHRHQPIPTSPNWVYLTQYVAGAEGWNCIETDAMVFYSRTYSWKNLEQAMGRIDRLDTLYTDLYYYILHSDSLVDRAIKRANVTKKLFNERKFAEKIITRML